MARLTANAVVYSGLLAKPGHVSSAGIGQGIGQIGWGLTLRDLDILYTNNHWSLTFSRGDQVGLRGHLNGPFHTGGDQKIFEEHVVRADDPPRATWGGGQVPRWRWVIRKNPDLSPCVVLVYTHLSHLKEVQDILGGWKVWILPRPRPPNANSSECTRIYYYERNIYIICECTTNLLKYQRPTSNHLSTRS